jgi:hypothetical protein
MSVPEKAPAFHMGDKRDFLAMFQNLMTQPARFVSSGQVLRLRLGLPMRLTIPFRLGFAQDDGISESTIP